MANVVNVGTTNDDGTGDTLRAAFSQINTRFNELLSTIDGGDAWATGVTYTATPIRQWVIESGQAYVVAVNHVSGASFAADLSAGKWFAVDSAQVLADLAASTGAGLVGFAPTGAITSTTVQNAIAEINTDLAASSGASLVGYLPAGTGAVATDVETKLREKVSVLDKGGVSGSDLTAALNSAITDLPATGGIIDCSMLQGAQIIAGKVSVNKPNTIILFGSATFTLSGVAALQSPFGAQFAITATKCWLAGDGATKFIMGAGAQANAVTFLHGGTLGGVYGIDMDGNKANNSAQSDDTFQSGIQIISSTGGGATANSRITVLNCDIHDFIHYGIVTYGDLSNDNIIQNNRIYGNGKSGDATSTGDGIYINKGSGRNLVTGNRCYSNQRSGIRLSTAGNTHIDNKVTDNWSYSNTFHGIFVDEQAPVSSVSGIGQSGLLIRGNHCHSNLMDGLRLGTYDNVGFIKDFTIDGNFFYSNSGYGILLQSNAHATDNTRGGIVSGNQVYSNTLDGIAIAANVLDTTVSGNNSHSNGGANILDYGTRSLVAVNKDGTTSPVWYETGTWTPADGSGAGLSLTISGTATYVKIGKMVYATFAITYPATANGATARIGGLPYTSQNSTSSMHSCSISFTTKAGLLSGVIDTNAQTFALVSTIGTTLNNSDVATSIIRGTAIYEVA